MNFDELIENMKSFEDTEEYKNYVNGFVNADSVTEFLKTDEGKKILEPLYHSHFSKSLETWKTNNLSKLVDEEYKKRYPDANPKDADIAALQAELEALKAESLRKDLTNKALTIATEKGLPVDLINFFVGENEETTTKNLETLETAFSAAVEKVVSEKLGKSHKPDAGSDFKELTAEDFAAMNVEEINEYFRRINN